jgi:hypothetical protein
MSGAARNVAVPRTVGLRTWVLKTGRNDVKVNDARANVVESKVGAA